MIRIYVNLWTFFYPENWLADKNQLFPCLDIHYSKIHLNQALNTFVFKVVGFEQICEEKVNWIQNLNLALTSVHLIPQPLHIHSIYYANIIFGNLGHFSNSTEYSRTFKSNLGFFKMF